MPKKYLIALFFMAFAGARHAVPLQGLPLLSDTAFAQLQENGQPCPPECVTDSMEIITYYPSPYGYYEELRGDKIIVGDTDNSHIDETHLPPPGTITFEPLLDDPDASDGSLYEGSLYYQGAIGGTKGKFRFYDGSDWQDVGGGGGIPNGMKIYDTLGSYTFNPAADCNGCARIMVEVWGGGGGGGGGCDSPSMGGAGGGGGYGKSVFAITPTAAYSVVVGGGGRSGSGYGGIAEDGTISSFGSPTLIYATGGKGGKPPKTGGAGGTSDGMVNVTGGYGGAASNYHLGIGGAAGGGGGPGGANASDSGIISASPGSAPGGGGGSGGDTCGNLPAEGASGRVIIYW